jgi:hypothetical protein
LTFRLKIVPFSIRRLPPEDVRVDASPDGDNLIPDNAPLTDLPALFAVFVAVSIVVLSAVVTAPVRVPVAGFTMPAVFVTVFCIPLPPVPAPPLGKLEFADVSSPAVTAEPSPCWIDVTAADNGML